MKAVIFCGLLFATLTAYAAEGLQSQPAPKDAKVYIISPSDGAVLTGPVTVLFGLQGMGVAPAGTDYPNTGHHHLLINAPEVPPANIPIPANEFYKHFGGGQTQTVLDLNPGKYSLQLLLGDAKHVPFAPPLLSEAVHITVKAADSK